MSVRQLHTACEKNSRLACMITLHRFTKRSLIARSEIRAQRGHGHSSSQVRFKSHDVVNVVDCVGSVRAPSA